jgi:hypothetical protein
VADGSVLISEHGNGATPALAIAAYARKIQGRILVFGACTSGRREFGVPQLKEAQ